MAVERDCIAGAVKSDEVGPESDPTGKLVPSGRVGSAEADRWRS